MARDPYKYFRIEARELLEQLGRGALDLEKGSAPPDSIAHLLRVAHTLKGAAGAVKRRDVAERAHSLEDALGVMRESAGAVTQELVDRALGLIDEIGAIVASLGQEPGAPELKESAETDQFVSAFRAGADELDSLLGGVAQVHVQLASLRPRLTQVERARHIVDVVVNQLARVRDADAARGAARVPDETARSLAEDLRNMFAALERDLASSVDQIDRELRQVRDTAERLRLTPVSALFTFLERAVRDVSKTLGKRVVFEATGGDVRVDASVLNVVERALLQIVRNAVAHGIEATDAERRAAGKPVEGHVTLRVTQHGSSVSFACADDGRGVDLEAVLRTAQRKGVRLEQNETIQPDDLLRLLLKGGISTSGHVTGVSGRGIGLDVVREAAERLGGEATARTQPGVGTTVELVVPLSVASFKAVVVEASGSTVAFPLHTVRALQRVTRDQTVRTEQRESILFDGVVVPLLPLAQVVLPKRPAPRSEASRSAVVVAGRSGTAAFTVDRVQGVGQVVMRALPDLAPVAPVVAGTALDAAGDPVLVINADRLVLDAQQHDALASDPAISRSAVLVVDDSLTTRMLEQSILESAGYEVELATSGEEGLEKARSGRHALFLVDVEMPGMDGFTFIERIRADPALQHIPAILVTSRTAPEDLQRGQDVGAQGYMIKSQFDQVALLEQIRTLVR